MICESVGVSEREHVLKTEKIEYVCEREGMCCRYVAVCVSERARRAISENVCSRMCVVERQGGGCERVNGH